MGGGDKIPATEKCDFFVVYWVIYMEISMEKLAEWLLFG
jgi:hypothetical protein